MSQIKTGQLRSLRDAMATVFIGHDSSHEIWDFFYYDVEFTDFVMQGVQPRLAIGEALAKLNANNNIGRVLYALEQRFSEADDLRIVISQLQPLVGPPPGSAAADRIHELEAAGLLLDGLAFINRSRLREILDELCAAAATARVGVITGASLCGKTWSHHLIRAHCRATGLAKPILLDMERIQPGNDPVLVWNQLLKCLMPDRQHPAPPMEDTTRGPYVARLVEEVCASWEAWEDPKREQKSWPLVIFDHLEKNAAAAVGPAVVDLAEAVAIAARDRHFEGARVLLLGFPRAFVGSQAMQQNVIAPQENVEPLSATEISRYLDEVGRTIGRGAPTRLVDEAVQLLVEADTKSGIEDRRTALLILSNTIGARVATLAKAV